MAGQLRVTGITQDTTGTITGICGDFWGPYPKKSVWESIVAAKGVGMPSPYIVDRVPGYPPVEVLARQDGHIFTEADGLSANNLDNLPPCRMPS